MLGFDDFLVRTLDLFLEVIAPIPSSEREEFRFFWFLINVLVLVLCSLLFIKVLLIGVCFFAVIAVF